MHTRLFSQFGSNIDYTDYKAIELLRGLLFISAVCVCGSQNATTLKSHINCRTHLRFRYVEM